MRLMQEVLNISIFSSVRVSGLHSMVHSASLSKVKRVDTVWRKDRSSVGERSVGVPPPINRLLRGAIFPFAFSISLFTFVRYAVVCIAEGFAME